MADEKKTEEEDLITKATKLRDDIKAENDRAEKILARAIVSGKAEAGIMPKPISPEDADRERINGILKATGLKI